LFVSHYQVLRPVPIFIRSVSIVKYYYLFYLFLPRFATICPFTVYSRKQPFFSPLCATKSPNSKSIINKTDCRPNNRSHLFKLPFYNRITLYSLFCWFIFLVIFYSKQANSVNLISCRFLCISLFYWTICNFMFRVSQNHFILNPFLNQIKLMRKLWIICFPFWHITHSVIAVKH